MTKQIRIIGYLRGCPIQPICLMRSNIASFRDNQKPSMRDYLRSGLGTLIASLPSRSAQLQAVALPRNEEESGDEAITYSHHLVHHLYSCWYSVGQILCGRRRVFGRLRIKPRTRIRNFTGPSDPRRASSNKGCVAFSLVAPSTGQACTLLSAGLPFRSFLFQASSVL